MAQVEYRISEVKKYIVTRICDDGATNYGEFDDYQGASIVGFNLCLNEHRETARTDESVDFIYPNGVDRGMKLDLMSID